MSLGEEKPQPFISLDIDQQIDGQLAPNSHVNFSPPDSHLPMLSNYLPHSSMSSPSQISQFHANTITTSPFALDGGVYQGQTSMQSNNWNSNPIVK